MNGYEILLLVIVAILSAVLFLVTKRYSYWQDQGILSAKTIFPYGNLKELGKKYHISQLLKIYYDQFREKAKYVGLYFFLQPVLLVMDLDLIKTVLIKDFNYFQNRGFYHNERDDPLSAHLVTLEGTKWKKLRAKLTPTFTSGKMKIMFPTIVAVSEKFEEYVSAAIQKDPVLEMKDALSRFTTDVIGTCAFGLECNSLKDPDAKFRQMGKKVFEIAHGGMKLFLMRTYGSIARFFRMKEFPEEISNFYLGVVEETVKYRETNNVHRNDFMDLLIKLKNTGSVDGVNNGSDDSLTIHEIAAQALVFFLAGFETSSTAMSYALYEFAMQPEVQEKARKCVQDVLKKHNGVLTYDAIMEMTYVEQCINESMRKYPPATTLMRVANADYNIPGTKHVIKKGDKLVIPIYALHHDLNYYPNPYKYDPDRFSPEQVAKRNPYCFIPFGEGPRACIGLRFGIMQARVGLAVLLNNFRITASSKTPKTLVIDKNKNILTSEGGLYLNVQKL